MPSDQRRAGLHAREAEFHDRLAAGAELSPPAPPDSWERSILSAAAPLESLRVLELGCGEGDLTMHLAGAGARVTALDLSQGMVDLARRRLEHFRPDSEVEFVVAPAEATGLPDAGFDVVVGKWVLHHLDLARGVDEVARVMRPGGRGVFVETSAFNPVLRTARRLVHRADAAPLGTEDEHPLTRADVELIGSRFRRCEVDHPDFMLLSIFARNVLRFRLQRTSRAIWRLDAALARRFRSLRPMSYFLRIAVEK